MVFAYAKVFRLVRQFELQSFFTSPIYPSWIDRPVVGGFVKAAGLSSGARTVILASVAKPGRFPG